MNETGTMGDLIERLFRLGCCLLALDDHVTRVSIAIVFKWLRSVVPYLYTYPVGLQVGCEDLKIVPNTCVLESLADLLHPVAKRRS